MRLARKNDPSAMARRLRLRHSEARGLRQLPAQIVLALSFVRWIAARNGDVTRGFVANQGSLQSLFRDRRQHPARAEPR